ncbi:hypothetical protein BJV82DRAFT_600804 [Fennellomyces sp. T-0311]|nr:hypothetical protein BJV82DRAFT_600804 [Fennellomyces sp. T-0311]
MPSRINNPHPLSFSDGSRHCKICNKSFTRRRDLKRHMLSSKAHRSEIIGCECPICGKTFTRPDIQRKHQANKSCIERFLKSLREAPGLMAHAVDDSTTY